MRTEDWFSLTEELVIKNKMSKPYKFTEDLMEDWTVYHTILELPEPPEKKEKSASESIFVSLVNNYLLTNSCNN